MPRRLYLVLLFLVVVRYVATISNIENGSRVRVTSQVLKEPIIYENSQLISLEGYRVYLAKYPEINYGDNLVLEGVVEDGVINNAELIELNTSSNILLVVRKQIIDNFRGYLPQDHAAVLGGVVLGSKTAISSEFWESLKASGTAHVVVASGTNVTYTALFMLTILLPILPRRKALPLVITSIWLYVVLSGFDAPLIRAALMGSVAFSAQAFGRLSNALNALFLSALLMLVYNPSWIGDYGFMLSFLATLSLILFEARVYKKITRLRLPEIFKRDLSTTIAAQIGVAPVLVYAFGGFNLLSPITNALVLWTIPPIMILGVMSGVLGLFVPIAGKLIAIVLYPLTSWFIFVVNFFNEK